MVLLVAFVGIPGEARAQERTFLPVSFELAWEIPPALESPLYLPWAMAPLSDGSIVVFDHGDEMVKRFSPPGVLEWSVGGKGEGPGEYLGATDLKVDANDRVWVLDRDDRVTELSALDGEVISTSRASRMHRLLPLASGGRVTLYDFAKSALLEVIDEDGSRQDWSPAGFDSELNVMEREAYIDGFRDASTALVAFRRSGQVVLLQRSDEGVTGRMTPGVEPLEFPRSVSSSGAGGAVVTRVDPRSYQAARWLGHDEAFFYVGFAGQSEARDVVDLYSTHDGEYRGSLRLPMEVDNATVVGAAMIAGLAREPIPHIRVWQLLFPSGARSP